MIGVLAAIEWIGAYRADLSDPHHTLGGPASAAEHCLLVEFSPGPNTDGMAGFQFVTVKAGIIGPAAVEFDRDDVELAAIMRATRIRIQLDASYRDSPNRKFHINYLRISPRYKIDCLI